MADRPKGYGMTAEVKERQEAKYDPHLESQAREWMQEVVQEPFPSGSFHEALHDGVYLCKLINAIVPGSVKKINESKQPFSKMENIGKFLDACYAYGCVKIDMFQTVDLYEAQNIPKVIDGIHTLGRRCQAQSYDGPVLGPKEAREQKREFTEEQRQAGKGVIGLQMGSNKGASQAGMTPYGHSRQIHQ